MQSVPGFLDWPWMCGVSWTGLQASRVGGPCDSSLGNQCRSSGCNACALGGNSVQAFRPRAYRRSGSSHGEVGRSERIDHKLGPKFGAPGNNVAWDRASSRLTV